MKTKIYIYFLMLRKLFLIITCTVKLLKCLCNYEYLDLKLNAQVFLYIVVNFHLIYVKL